MLFPCEKNSDTGRYDVKIPGTLLSKNNYPFKINVKSNNTIVEAANGTFSIVDKPAAVLEEVFEDMNNQLKNTKKPDIVKNNALPSFEKSISELANDAVQKVKDKETAKNSLPNFVKESVGEIKTKETVKKKTEKKLVTEKEMKLREILKKL
jgi:hypothetical protein